MFILYSFLYAVAIAVLFFPQYFKRSRQARKKWLSEKLGYLSPMNSTIWVHAVSVGEVNASVPLLKRLRAAYPHIPIVLSTITETGQKVARERVPEGTRIIYLPFDMEFILKRCYDRLRPKILIVMETELWPNLFRVLSAKGVPVIVLNGRISESSFRGYRKISFFMKKVFADVRFFGLQYDIDADRLRKIGAEEKKISVLGNFKFDITSPGEIPAWARLLQGPVLIAGSTHRGEEEIIISAFRENVARFPGIKLVIAPRHPERFKDVEALLRASGIPFIKRSDLIVHDSSDNNSESGIVLLDSVGELAAVYGIADVVIIGKSFTGFGGQNPLEAAFWGKPIICGPHMENFPFITDFYKEGAAFATEKEMLGRKIGELLDAPGQARAAGEKAKELCMDNSGAVDRAMSVVSEYIG